MAVYLKDFLKKMAQDKGLDWPDSRDRVVFDAQKKLESDRGKLEEIWKGIEAEFSGDMGIGKISKYDLEDVKKEISRKF